MRAHQRNYAIEATWRESQLRSSHILQLETYVLEYLIKDIWR
jgi:hypothetical protein